MWHRSTVSKLLRSRSVVGDLVPGCMDYSSGRPVRRLEEPIPDAFPAIVSRNDWLAVRALKDGRAPAVRGRGASLPLSNVFAGLARCCECGAAMTRVYKGSGPKGGKAKLVCTRAKAGAAQHPYRSQDLDTLHAAFWRHWGALVADIPVGERGGGLDCERADLLGAIDATENRLADLQEGRGQPPSGARAARIRALEAALGS